MTNCNGIRRTIGGRFNDRLGFPYMLLNEREIRSGKVLGELILFLRTDRRRLVQ